MTGVQHLRQAVLAADTRFCQIAEAQRGIVGQQWLAGVTLHHLLQTVDSLPVIMRYFTLVKSPHWYTIASPLQQKSEYTNISGIS